jgi:hypothetical protein
MRRLPSSRTEVFEIQRRRGTASLVLLGLLAAPVWAWARYPTVLFPCQSARLLILVTDENGRPIAGARALLERPEMEWQQLGETDHVGRLVFTDLAPGLYRLRVEKERFYVLTISDVRIPENETLELVLHRRHELVETVDVRPTSSALDPWQTAAHAELSTSEVLTLPTSVMRDLRYSLAFLPGIVRDASGSLHVAGSAASQTLALLDGFMVAHPITGLLDLRVSVDAIREVRVYSSRYSAEYGRGSGGVLDLSTAIGEDRFRFSATDFIPSFQSRKGIHLNNWTPRVTLSGPLRKKRAWFYEAFEGEYDVAIVEELPRGADRNRAWRWSHLAKAQVNMTASHLLTVTLLTNRFRSPYEGLSRFVPRETTRHIARSADFLAVKGHVYRPDGLFLEYGAGAILFRDTERPWGEAPYILSPEGARGHFFRSSEQRAHRMHGLVNLVLPSFSWRGRHEVKIGADWIHLGAREHTVRRPLLILRGDGSRARLVQFTSPSEVRERGIELAVYGQDRWFISRRSVLELGLRWDWDSLRGAARWSPRLAVSSLLTRDRQTRLIGGLGLFYDAIPLGLITYPSSGRRTDIFYARDGRTPQEIVETAFHADVRALAPSRAFIWSLGLERQLPAAFVLSLEFLQKRGHRGWAYVPFLEPAEAARMPGGMSPSPLPPPRDLWIAWDIPSPDEHRDAASSPARLRLLDLRDGKRDRYDALHLTLRWTLRETHPLFASYVRSRARSTAVLDFTPDTLLFGAQAGGPLPWDTPHRALLWGWMPLPKRFLLAYALEGRNGYPFLVVTGEHRLAEPPNRRRLPTYFSLNLHLERRFHLFGLQWAVRVGFNNVTNHPNPSTVNNNVDSPQFLTPGGAESRSFIGRLRLLGRK